MPSYFFIVLFTVLSESAEFAQACADSGITFVGPSVENLETFGDKTKARELAIKSGVSVSSSTCFLYVIMVYKHQSTIWTLTHS